MSNSPLCKINLISRLALGLVYIYHGLVPKILWLSEIEKQLVVAGGFNPEHVHWLSPLAGVAEIILGSTIIYFRQYLAPVYIAAGALIGLLLYVAVLQPELLIEAFNPVSTNLMGLIFCYLIMLTQSQRSA